MVYAHHRKLLLLCLLALAFHSARAAAATGAPVLASASPEAEGVVALSGESFGERFEAGEFHLDLGRDCQADSGLSAEQLAIFAQRLDRLLSPILSPENPLEIRKHFAYQLLGEELRGEAHESLQRFDQLRADVISGRPEQVVSGLYELGAKVLVVAQLREARATMTSIYIEDGALKLRLIKPVVGRDPLKVMGRAVLGELERVKSEGLNCVESDTYQRFSELVGERVVPTFDTMKQGDLLALYNQNNTLVNEYTALIGLTESTGEGFKVHGEDSESATATYNQIHILFVKAIAALETALEMHGTFLEENGKRELSRVIPFPEEALEARPPAPVTARAVGPGVRDSSSVGVPPAEGAAAAVGASSAASAPAATALSAASGPVAGSSGAQAIKSAPLGQDTQAHVAQSLQTARLEPEPSALDAERQRIRDRIEQESNRLRQQSGPAGMVINTNPIGVARNLLTRMKRLYEISEMLVADSKQRDVYTCKMSDGRVRVSYSKRRGKLRSLRVDVDERLDQEVLLTWNISLQLENDANFILRSEFEGIKASMTVENSEPTSYPNFQQLMVLMNRLSTIMNRG